MKISSIRELGKIADKIKKILSPGDVVFLYGEIGVGKTTFSRLLINGFEKLLLFLTGDIFANKDQSWKIKHLL